MNLTRRTKNAPPSNLLGTQVRVRGLDAKQRTVEVIASTDAEDRHGEVIEQVWRLEGYIANPVVLYGHDRDALPIGKAENVRVEGGQLRATLRFVGADVNPKAEQVFQLLQEGVLRAVSVGFLPHSYRREMKGDRELLVLSDNELLEISVVPIPANPEALAQMRARALAQKSPAPDRLQAGVAELTGGGDADAQLGKLRAWKEASAQVATLQARVAELEANAAKFDREKALRVEADEREALIAQGVADRKLTPAQARKAEGDTPAGWARTTPLAELKAFLAEAVPVVPAPGAHREAPPAAVKGGLGALATKRWDELTPIEKDRLYHEAPEVYQAKKAEHAAKHDG